MNGGVCLFSFDYPPLAGGISRVCAAIARGLAERGADLRILTHASSGPAETLAPHLSEVHVTPRRPFRELAALRELRRRGRSGPVICGVWYPEGLLALVAGAKPLLILAHGSELLATRARWRRGLWKRLLRRVLTGADLVVANSSFTLRLVKVAAPGSDAVAVPLAVDHRRFAPGDRGAAKRRFGAEGKLVLSSASRIRRYKGHDVIFRALASLPGQVRGRFVHFVAGRGSDKEALQAEARRLGVADLVRWLGFVPEGELPELYRASDLFVLCTRESRARQEVEGFGLVFLEAQACGTPVVGTRTGGIPDAVSDCEGGWLIDEDDSAALAGILTRLADEPDAFRRAGQVARARIEREFTWNRYIERFVSELEARGITIG